MELINIMTGGILGYLLSVVAFMYTTRKDKKEAFIKTVTEARKDFMEKLRTLTAEFCYLATTNPASPDLNRIKYELLFYLFPDDYPEWDGEIVKLMDQLIKLKSGPDFEKTLTNFIIRSRYNLQIEWKGLKKEGKKGILSDVTTEELRQETLVKCIKSLKAKGII
jgi:hypothetical protein